MGENKTVDITPSTAKVTNPPVTHQVNSDNTSRVSTSTDVSEWPSRMMPFKYFDVEIIEALDKEYKCEHNFYSIEEGTHPEHRTDARTKNVTTQ